MNGVMLQYFHWYLPDDGSLWKKLINDIPKLKELGISAVWLPPAYKSASGNRLPGYDVYDLFDLGEFDQKGSVKTKYGSKDEYLAAVHACREAGINVYADVVVNHKAGADETEKVQVVEVKSDNRNEVISEPFEAEVHTKFTFPARNDKYSSFVWDFHCFTGTDCIETPEGQKCGVYRILNEWGEGWQEMVGDEFGNFDYLMFSDIDFRNPHVKEELKYWIKWYYETVGFNGLRLDAVKHIPPSFWKEFIDHVRSFAPDMFVVAEYWTPDKELIQQYMEATEGRMSFFNSVLQNNFHHASKAGKDFDLTRIFENTFVDDYPELSVTLVDNHDTQPLQSLEAPIEPWFKTIAYSIILLRAEGYPCIFYPDLFETPSYKDKGRDGNEHEIFLAPSDGIETLLKARQLYAWGEQRNYFDHNNCIGWTRAGDDEHEGCAVLISNSEAGFKSMEIGQRYAGKTFVDLLGKNDGEVQIDENGWGTFLVSPASVSVWIEKK
jgi:alpha-amylase